MEGLLRCSRGARQLGTRAARAAAAAARLAAKQIARRRGPRVQPPAPRALRPPFISQPAGDRFCSLASPSAAVPHYAASWCAQASEDGDSLTERILFLADGSHSASTLLSSLGCRCSGPIRSARGGEAHFFFAKGHLTSGAAVPIMDGNSAATDAMLPLASFRPQKRNGTRQNTEFGTQNFVGDLWATGERPLNVIER